MNAKKMTTPMIQKEIIVIEDVADKVDEAHFRNFVGCV